jgi:hypothetical protein
MLKMPMLLIVLLEAISLIYVIALMNHVLRYVSYLLDEVMSGTSLIFGVDFKASAEQLRKSIPFLDEIVSMISQGQARPSIAEYPAIAQHIRQAINEVCYGLKDPHQALQDGATKSAKALGW